MRWFNINFFYSSRERADEVCAMMKRESGRLLPTLLGADGAGVRCVASEQWITQRAARWNTRSSSSLFLCFSLLLPLSRYSQACKQARSNRFYRLLLRGTRAYVALGRKREEESLCIASTRFRCASARTLRWGKQNASEMSGTNTGERIHISRTTWFPCAAA